MTPRSPETLPEYVPPFTVHGVSELVALCREPVPTGAGQHSVTNEATRDWDLGSGFERALKALESGGDPKITAKVTERAFDFTPPEILALSAGSMRNDVAGPLVDVAAYVSGRPDCMRTPRHALRPLRFLPIHFYGGGNAATSAADLVNRGAAIVALIDSMEAQGVRTLLVSHMTASTTYNKLTQEFGARVILKDYHEPIDIDLLAFMVAHPAAFRRLGFRCMEHSKCRVAQGHTRRGYGFTIQERPADLPPDALWLPGMQGDDETGWRDPVATVQRLIAEAQSSLTAS